MKQKAGRQTPCDPKPSISPKPKRPNPQQLVASINSGTPTSTPVSYNTFEVEGLAFMKQGDAPDMVPWFSETLHSGQPYNSPK